MEPISFTASAPFAICRKICCLWLAILLILCIITYTSIRVFIFTRISFSTTSSKVDLGQLCFSTSELLSSCIVYGNKIIVIVNYCYCYCLGSGSVWALYLLFVKIRRARFCNFDMRSNSKPQFVIPNWRCERINESYINLFAEKGNYRFSLFITPSLREILLAIFWTCEFQFIYSFTVRPRKLNSVTRSNKVLFITKHGISFSVTTHLSGNMPVHSDWLIIMLSGRDITFFFFLIILLKYCQNPRSI